MRIIYQVFLAFLVVCILAFLCGKSYADTTEQATDTSKVVTIIGVDTTTFFTAIESLVKNAAQTYHAVALDKDVDISYRTMYVLVRGRGLIKKEILVPAGGLETDWHESGGVFGGLEALDEKSDKFKNTPVNGIAAVAVEGTTSKDKDGWNTLFLLAGRVNFNALNPGTSTDTTGK